MRRRFVDPVRSICAVNWHAVRMYRLADRLYRGGHYRKALLVATFSRVMCGVEIEPGATIGDGLVIIHGHGIVIHREVVMGEHVVVHQQCTLGMEPAKHTHRLDGQSRAPRIGDRVVIYAGAKVVGPVTVGDDAIIGANAVVVNDVPSGCVAVGVPARVLPSRRPDVDGDVGMRPT